MVDSMERPAARGTRCFANPARNRRVKWILGFRPNSELERGPITPLPYEVISQSASAILT